MLNQAIAIRASEKAREGVFTRSTQWHDVLLNGLVLADGLKKPKSKVSSLE